jgi:hypothetical protein
LSSLRRLTVSKWVHGEGSDTAAKFLAMPRLITAAPGPSRRRFFRQAACLRGIG